MAENKNLFKSVQKFNSDLTPDCAKFCPIKGFESFLVIAYYELRDQEVYGSLELYQVEQNKLVLKDKVESAGVLDFQWFGQQIDNTVFLSTACSDSFVRIYSLQQQKEGQDTKLHKEREIQTEEGHKCLYIDVNITLPQIRIVTSTDQESVFIIDLAQNLEPLKEISKISKHQFSVWACGISKEDQNIFLSGGDDQKLILYDVRVPDFQVMVNKRSHEMGICTINFDPLNPNQFFTGCYDEHLRLWDVRNIQKEIFASKREGGVWRAIWKPQSSSQALLGVYCQHYFEIVDLIGNTKVEQQEKLEGHTSLAYSCDWSQDTKNIITCSFYDKIVQLWSLQE
ncbi:hypothetical protein ABPG74_003209 [Tetrahymena malaccensis]